MSSSTCPLCLSKQIDFYHKDKMRTYWQCQDCDLVFVAHSDLPSRERELKEYQLHQNSSDDDGYRAFLSRLAEPLTARLPPAQKGLDFGCGPSPVLASMLKQAGHLVALYDPFFHPNQAILNERYDFISCTEAIEHFHYPHTELRLWDSMLKENGWLAVMTKRVINKTRFTNWHYKNDQTHVSFFSDKTFTYIGREWGYQVDIISPDVVLLQKVSQNPL